MYRKVAARHKVDFQIIYILHYIGLAWNFAHWIMDAAQILPHAACGRRRGPRFWTRQISQGSPLRHGSVLPCRK